MKVNCQRCNKHEVYNVPEFSISEKNKIKKMKSESPIKAVKILIDNYNLNHTDAKFIISNINLEFG